MYKIWQEYRVHFPTQSRYTLGDRTDNLFVDILELLFVASYQKGVVKLPTLRHVILKIDTLKFMVRVVWELKILDNVKYIVVSEKLEEIGKMVGGWKKGLESKTPPN